MLILTIYNSLITITGWVIVIIIIVVVPIYKEVLIIDCSFLYTIIDNFNLFINLLKSASGSKTVY